MEMNRATTLANVLARDRALDARDRKDTAIEKGRLAKVHPGSEDFREALGVLCTSHAVQLRRYEEPRLRLAHRIFRLWESSPILARLIGEFLRINGRFPCC